MDIEQIKIELLNKVERLNGTHNIFQQGEKHQCELVLLMISKLHQPTVSKCFEEKEFYDCGRSDKVIHCMVCDAPTK